MLRWLTAGESHGPRLIGIIDGVPAGINLVTGQIENALARRRLGYGRGSRQKFEQDVVSISAGVRHGKTTGAPIGIIIENSEWPKWEAVMSADPVPPSALQRNAGKGDERELARNLPLTRPRPGHADLVGMLKYDTEDARNILERASARETAMKVALGQVAEVILSQIAGVELVSHVVGVGQVSVDSGLPKPTPQQVQALDDDPVRCLDPQASIEMVKEIDCAKTRGETLGGVVEVIVYGLPIGLGSYVQSDQRLDGRLASAIMSVPAIKGVEIGDGFTSARRPGSKAHDEILVEDLGHISRQTNRAGGIEGGISNGQPMVVRAAMKPISTVPHPLNTIDMATGKSAKAVHQRSDVCAVAPAAVVCQAVTALTLAQALLELTGGDSLVQAQNALKLYLERIGTRI